MHQAKLSEPVCVRLVRSKWDQPFAAPNPDYLPFVPVNQMSKLADIISGIMKNGGLGVP